MWALTGNVFAIILCLAVGGMLGYAVIGDYRNKIGRQQYAKEQERMKYRIMKSATQKYTEDKALTEVPRNAHEIPFLSPSNYGGLIGNTTHFFWYDAHSFIFYPFPPSETNYYNFENIKQLGIAIPISSILYFALAGDVFREQKISGGGADIGGAIIGGMIAGTAGAIVGGREAIRSDLVTHDTRYTQLVVRDEDGEHILRFSPDAFLIFDKYIPEKEKTILDEIIRRKLVDKAIDSRESEYIPLPDKSYPRRRRRIQSRELSE